MVARSNRRLSAASICSRAAVAGLGLEGVVDHLLAERDQLAPHMEIVDQPAIIEGVDDGRRAADQAGEIAVAALGDQVGIVA